MRSRKWLKLAHRMTSRCLRLCLMLSLCALLYAKWIEPNWIEVNSMEMTLPHLASEFDGYRIVQISDIHTDRWMTQRRLNRLFRLVNQQKPDLVAITGDFVTRYRERFIPNLKATLAHLTPKDKTVAVLGNHDHWTNPQAIAQVLLQTGILNLSNTIYTLERGSSLLHIAGVDDVSMGKDRLDLVLEELPNQGAAILLAHEPDFADISAATERFDLQLSGHSHAGQVRIPFFKPLALPVKGEKYYSGLYQIGNMIEYTNRGIGMTGIHMRFSCRPEITVFTLKAPHEGEVKSQKSKVKSIQPLATNETNRDWGLGTGNEEKIQYLMPNRQSPIPRDRSPTS